jgi:valyl-tRNA synthetase
MSEAAGRYAGMDRFATRKQIVKDLEAEGFLVKVEDYKNQVGYSERTQEVIEPRLSMQWWCRMETLAVPALEAVNKQEIEFYPGKFKNLYRVWMENIKDWCISRQLWWGQRIPAWYDEHGNIIVARNEEEARQQLANPAAILTQDEDVLDTWFSSWLWPMQVFGWYQDPGNAELKYYYPTNTLVTAPEIIFFWVARMIMGGYEFLGQRPFQQVYFTGIVRDKQGRKMSKSLGNSPDLLALIDEHGADAVRFSVMISSPAGNDLLYDEAALEQGRNFCNKMWNALKLVKGWENRTDAELAAGDSSFAIQWMENRLAEVAGQLDGLFASFNLSEALKTIYSLIWDDFCSWYLEWVKPPMDSPVSAEVYASTIRLYEQMLQLLHPYLPFVTEEIYHQLATRAQGDDLIERRMEQWPALDNVTLAQGRMLKQIVTAVRDTRNKNGLKPRDTVALYIDTTDQPFYLLVAPILTRSVNATSLEFTPQPVADTISIVVHTDKIYLSVPHLEIDLSLQRDEMVKELAYLQGFLGSVEKKLGNPKFVANAKPEVIQLEQKKKQDAEARIKTLTESLQDMASE